MKRIKLISLMVILSLTGFVFGAEPAAKKSKTQASEMVVQESHSLRSELEQLKQFLFSRDA